MALTNFSSPPSAGTASLTPLIDTTAAARLLGVSKSLLEKARVRASGPPFVRVSGLVRYDLALLRRWIAEQVRTSTADRGETHAE